MSATIKPEAIVDNSIEKIKLIDSVKSSLNKADSAIQNLNNYRIASNQDIIDNTKLYEPPQDGNIYVIQDGNWIKYDPIDVTITFNPSVENLDFNEVNGTITLSSKKLSQSEIDAGINSGIITLEYPSWMSINAIGRTFHVDKNNDWDNDRSGTIYVKYEGNIKDSKPIHQAERSIDLQMTFNPSITNVNFKVHSGTITITSTELTPAEITAGISSGLITANYPTWMTVDLTNKTYSITENSSETSDRSGTVGIYYDSVLKNSYSVTQTKKAIDLDFSYSPDIWNVDWHSHSGTLNISSSILNASEINTEINAGRITMTTPNWITVDMINRKYTVSQNDDESSGRSGYSYMYYNGTQKDSEVSSQQKKTVALSITFSPSISSVDYSTHSGTISISGDLTASEINAAIAAGEITCSTPTGLSVNLSNKTYSISKNDSLSSRSGTVYLYYNSEEKDSKSFSQSGKPVYLTISVSPSSVGYGGGSGTVTISSSTLSNSEIDSMMSAGSITVSKSASWLTLNISSHSGSYSVSGHTSTSSRSDTIYVKYNGSNKDSATISQAARPADTFNISFSPSISSVDYNSHSGNVSITSNNYSESEIVSMVSAGSLTIEKPSWMSISFTSSSKSYSINTNDSLDSRSGTVYLKQSGSTKDSESVSQSGKPVNLSISFSPEITGVAYTGASGSVSVSSTTLSDSEITSLISSGKITVSCPSWMSINLSGKTYSITANSSESSRSGSVDIKYNGSTKDTKSVSQNGMPVTTFSMTFDPSISNVDYNSHSGSVSITSNNYSESEIISMISAGTVTISKPSWMSINFTSSNKSYTINENTSTDSRSDNVILKYNGTQKASVSVSQSGKPEVKITFTFNPITTELPASNGQGSVTISGNISQTEIDSYIASGKITTTCPSWITIDLANKKYYYNQNTGSLRSGTIKLYYDSKEQDSKTAQQYGVPYVKVENYRNNSNKYSVGWAKEKGEDIKQTTSLSPSDSTTFNLTNRDNCIYIKCDSGTANVKITASGEILYQGSIDSSWIYVECSEFISSLTHDLQGTLTIQET